jgi:hypothetical protein
MIFGGNPLLGMGIIKDKIQSDAQRSVSEGLIR